MTIPAINAVGFCAHYSREGDWAFDFAMHLAVSQQKRLNIFHFRADPYNPEDEGPIGLSKEQYDQFLIEREKEMRLYYDTRLGDYVDAGFRLCEDNEWTELHRCLYGHEFQVLVLGVPRPEATFAGRPIQEFAASFACPLILVGPDSKDEIRLNRPAALMAEKFGLDKVRWSLVTEVTVVPVPAVAGADLADGV